MAVLKSLLQTTIPVQASRFNLDDSVEDTIDEVEIYDVCAAKLLGFIHMQLIKNIIDPEHPNTLEQLRIVNIDDIHVNREKVCEAFV